jgi:hypothetical protein
MVWAFFFVLWFMIPCDIGCFLSPSALCQKILKCTAAYDAEAYLQVVAQVVLALLSPSHTYTYACVCVRVHVTNNW